MSIILEAFSPIDAVAIIRSNQCLRLYRPPYQSSNAIKLPETAIEDAVLNHDFHASGKVFDSFAALIDFLRVELLAARELIGRPVPKTLNNIAILNIAPLVVLQGFLKKVEDELIPQREFSHARNFLYALLESTASQEYPPLKTQAISFLKQIQAIEESKNNSATVLEKKYSLFKNSPQGVEKIADFVRNHGFFNLYPQGV